MPETSPPKVRCNSANSDLVPLGVIHESEIYRRGIQAAVTAHHAYRVVSYGSTTSHALGMVSSGSVRALLLSVELASPYGVSFIQELKERAPLLKLAVLAAAPTPRLKADLSSIGVGAIVDRYCSTAELLNLLDSLFPEVANERQLAFQLTARERDVVHLLAAAATNREIGRWLGIAEGTVKRHLANICDKLAVRSRLEIVTAARRRGLCD